MNLYMLMLGRPLLLNICPMETRPIWLLQLEEYESRSTVDCERAPFTMTPFVGLYEEVEEEEVDEVGESGDLIAAFLFDSSLYLQVHKVVKKALKLLFLYISTVILSSN